MVLHFEYSYAILQITWTADSSSDVTADDVKESAYPWPLQPSILNVPVCQACPHYNKD